MFSQEEHEFIDELETATMRLDCYGDAKDKQRLGKLLRKIVGWIESEDNRQTEAAQWRE